ncbi:MAG TPA: hypothetical protein VHB77_12070 [Planctomycetaceae bacterium]|nr:hypothetical protein [Planctomycetaceae bacterium]
MTMKAAAVLGICIIIAALIVALLPFGVGEVGRYQIISTSGQNCFVLDTKTGRLWQRFVQSNGGPTYWTEDQSPWAKEKQEK